MDTPAAEKVVAPVSGEPSTPPVKTVTEAPKPITTTEGTDKEVKPEVDGNKVDNLIPSDPYYMDPLFYEMANYFGINQEEYGTAKNKLSEILEYVIRDKKSNKPEDVLSGLRALEDKIQPPGWDEKRYTNVYKYIRLATKDQTIQQAMKAFEKGGYNS